MWERKKFLFIVLCLTFFILEPVTAQRYSFREELKWQINTKNAKEKIQGLQFLTFNGAQVQFLPDPQVRFIKWMPLTSHGTLMVTLKDEKYVPVSDTLLVFGKEKIHFAPRIEATVETEALKPVALIYIEPFRRNSGSGQLEQLESFELTVELKPDIKERNNSINLSKKGPYESVLSTGAWYKLGVTENGVHKIDFNLLKQIGFDPGSIDPRKIKIYGKQGGMLPQANNAERDSDLTENAIYISGEQDGKFDAADYILFYAKGPISWSLNTSTGLFEHTPNYYSDTSYYFITVGADIGKRVKQAQFDPGKPSQDVSEYDAYRLHEIDQLTEITKTVKSGREWYGEEFKSFGLSNIIEKNFDFRFSNIVPGSLVNVRASTLAHSPTPSYFYFKYNNTTDTQVISGIPPGFDEYEYAYERISKDAFDPGDDNISVNIKYQKTSSESIGFLNYIELNARCKLIFSGNQMEFRNTSAIKQGYNNSYKVSNTNSGLKVWNVTDFHDIKDMPLNFSGAEAVFLSPADSMQEFIVFEESNLPAPAIFGYVNNQNLHALENPDMVIVSAPSLLQVAHKFADFHRQHDNFIVHVVTPNQIYNEFSSGTQDVTAIRDFMKMFYDRSLQGEKEPGYLMFIGDASYDYKNRLDKNTNLVPTYQSYNSISPTGSFGSDDFFGFLDDNEGAWLDYSSSGQMDIAIGRLPVQTLEEAEAIYQKVLRYHSPSAQGEWRNILTFVADDPDGVDPSYNYHMRQSETVINSFKPEAPSFNLDKIYADAYRQESSPTGPRYPGVNNAINKRMEAGTLIMNYSGHGGEVGWGHERFLELNDIASWKNPDNMPLLITATCEFSRYDDPHRVSAGEQSLMLPGGGPIALYSTSRVVYISDNEVLNRNILKNNFFKKENGEVPRIGDIFMRGKNMTGFSFSIRNFILLGDPALKLAMPKYDVVVKKINDKPVNGSGDTVGTLTLVTVSGEIQFNGMKLSDFNGEIIPTVYDKENVRYTLANDGGEKVPFVERDNIIFKGLATVTGGEFTFSFMVPKDVSFEKGNIKLSLYARNGKEDGNGYYDNIVVNGSGNPVEDSIPPTVRVFINDTNFVSGGIVNDEPVLVSLVSDDMGINTLGNGVGHNLTGTLNTGETYILNDYYKASKDDYRSGTIIYPIGKLPEGKYRIDVKVWDVSNNSGEGFTEFVVTSSGKLVIEKLFNYPNPMTSYTKFGFSHNHPNEDLKYEIAVFSSNGKFVESINGIMNSKGNVVTDIEWNGYDSFGNNLSSGIYIYKLTVRTRDGKIAQQSQKLVVIK